VPIADAFPGIEAVDVRVQGAFDRVVGTSVDPYELLCICAIERFIGASSVLEIGTDEGNTTLNLAANAPEGGRIVTVDVPDDWPGHKYPNPERTVGAKFAAAPEAAAISQVLGDSGELDWNELGGPFDLIFIDGCHDYECVRKDTDNALAQLSENGVVIWHDYAALRSVSRAVDEASRIRPVRALQGTRLAVTAA